MSKKQSLYFKTLFSYRLLLETMKCTYLLDNYYYIRRSGHA
nr:MAG TPA: hypothetical protein [Bacteriophage sp.]